MKFISYLLFGLLAIPAQGAEFYPQQLSQRLFGTNQGNVGDCAAEAQVGALESAFAARGFGFVKLSLFYRNAVVGASRDAKDLESMGLALNDADRALLQRAGPLLPDFMWPEDGAGIDLSQTGTRPHPSDALEYDPEFTAPNNIGFSVTQFTLSGGYTTSVDLNWLKTNIAQGNAVTLSVHGDLLQPTGPFSWDDSTGFPLIPYNWKALLDELTRNGLNGETGINHEVAAVGFDDSLYTDAGYAVPGAIIIRNTWNDQSHVEAALGRTSAEQNKLLQKMRFKISGKNLPGFYAIPMQYLVDQAANGLNSMQVYSVNYQAFADAYLRISSRYSTVITPFVCEQKLNATKALSDGAKRELLKFKKAMQTLADPARSKDEKAAASKLTYELSLRELGPRQLSTSHRFSPTFNYATLARRAGSPSHQANAFYGGAFRDYYCPGLSNDSTGIWPTQELTNLPAVASAMDSLSANQGSFVEWYQFLQALSQQVN